MLTTANFDHFYQTVTKLWRILTSGMASFFYKGIIHSAVIIWYRIPHKMALSSKRVPLEMLGHDAGRLRSKCPTDHITAKDIVIAREAFNRKASRRGFLQRLIKSVLSYDPVARLVDFCVTPWRTALNLPVFSTVLRSRV